MPRSCIALLLVLAAVPAAAQDEGPASVVAAFHAALASGDSAAAIRLMAPDVIIFESGGAESSAAEYASHHLPGDMAFSAATTRTMTNQQVRGDGDIALVLTWSRTAGTFRDRAIDVTGVETMVLHRTPEGWRIAHVHWSSRRN